jgi:hypothetical protein
LPSQLALGTYEFKIRAKDIEGAWSDEVIKTISLTATPMVQFEADLTTADANNPLTAFKTNNYLKWHNIWTRYPYAHHLEMSLWNDGTLVSALPYQWQTNDAGNYIVSGNDRFWYDLLFYLPSNIGLTDKTYQARIEAVSELNGERKMVEGEVTIVANQPPTISSSVSRNTLYEGESNKIALVVDDPDKTALSLTMALYKDGIPFYETSTTESPSGGVYEPQIISFNSLPAGTYTGNASVSDGMASSSTTFAFEVLPFHVTLFDIYGAWHHWRGQVDAFGEQLSDMPHRFLSFESITFRVALEGIPDNVSIRLSPELEAMVFEDDYGHEYDYTEEIGDWVYFPLSLSCVEQNIDLGTSVWEGEYILPLASSTLDWDNDRAHPPYQATMTATLGGYAIQSTIDDIEITGNIKDLIYMQPSF